MTYSYSIFESIDQADPDHWGQLCGDPSDPFMDPRFLRSVERSMASQGRFWHLIVYDAQGRPAAAACLSLIEVDGTVLAGGWPKRIARGIRRVWPGYLRFNVLFLGLPVSAGQSQLRVRADADRTEVLRVLDAVLSETAARHGCKVIVLKEFDSSEIELIDGLVPSGYLRADSLPMNHFEPRFSDFDEYYSALRKTFRKSVRYSLQKYERAELRTESIRGDAEAVESLWTDSMHEMYEAVLARSAS